MTEKKRRARIAAMIADEEKNGAFGWHYLSFASETFLGAVIVKAFGMTTAIRRSHELGINPGGSVQHTPFPDDLVPPEKYCYRLLTKAEVLEMDEVLLGGATPPPERPQDA